MNQHAKSLGKLGGHARAAKMTREARVEAARRAIKARWDRRPKPEAADSSAPNK